LAARLGRGCVEEYFGWSNNIINNIAVTPCPTGNSLYANNSTLIDNPLTTSSVSTTLAAAVTSITATSVTLTSAANFPGGSNGYPTNGSFTFPGGNEIQIDSEVMLVTAGWGTTTPTVQRGYAGTTAATHANRATVTWVPDYAAHNQSGSSCLDINTANGLSTIRQIRTRPLPIRSGSM
jgi:hypothetical protein